jgi:uncharacterized SAM-binding protein YcdF (DUF218 family)
MFNDLFSQLDLLHLKPIVRALLLPPVPLLLLALGWLWWPRRGDAAPPRRLGLSLLLASLWLVGTPAVGTWLTLALTQPPPPLSAAQRQALTGARDAAVLVLGAGREPVALELDGAPDLTPLSLARLRHGAWLSRQTGLPLGYSGGLGHGSAPGPDEAQVAARVAQQELGLPLRWREDRSRDTRENARFSVAMLHRDGIRRIVLVTHAAHQRRALAAFERALADQGLAMTLLPAPVAWPTGQLGHAGDWLPTPRGLQLSWMAVYEALGRWGGA